MRLQNQKKTQGNFEEIEIASATCLLLFSEARLRSPWKQGYLTALIGQNTSHLIITSKPLNLQRDFMRTHNTKGSCRETVRAGATIKVPKLRRTFRVSFSKFMILLLSFLWGAFQKVITLFTTNNK